MNTIGVTKSFNKHREEPDIDVESHIHNLRIDLGKAVAIKKKIYLDLRYWIFIRDAYLGDPKKSVHIELLKNLRLFVKSGLGICPISESVFCELNKQTDMKTRNATAELIDELSLGVAMCPFTERVGTEIATFLNKSMGLNTHSLQELIWLKLCFVLGVVWPSNTTFDDQTELVIQKSFTDHMWDISLTEIIETLGNSNPIKSPMFDNLAKNINIGNEKHKDEIVSFKQVYRCEASGGFSLFKTTTVDILKKMYPGQYTYNVDLSEIERKKKDLDHEDKMHTMFVNLLCSGTVSNQLPSLHIHTKCYAAIRWDKKRKIKPNDIYDFQHAAGAVAYCDAFFTEKPLKVLLTSKNVAVDKEMDCTVICDEEEALAYLYGINGL